ncbi:transposase [Cucumis melo var. makuwa]|uniref:Transposase n=1 Tax=Cucumis melo var. makuwa TaxID=1194695 RepID=A0A5D3CPY0_CUCMM|nr:transposase [Cucumis melo var. makuwa]
MKYEKIHACRNDCCLFRKELSDANVCPSCGMSRWKIPKNSKKEVKNVPVKVMWYFSPIPRFERMFRSKETSKLLTWHGRKREVNDLLQHPKDALSWKKIDNLWPEFGSEPRNLRLALSTDGVNPHGDLSSRYSCWPVMLVTYNLPPWLCMKRKFLMLTALISGPKQPGNEIDVYLAPLVDDLKILWHDGVECYDAYQDQCFRLKAILLWTINDFPAYGNLCGCTVKGYHACPICGEKTSSIYLPKGRKMAYIGHRKFLPRHHPYRKQKKVFNGAQELELAPEPLSGEEIFIQTSKYKHSFGKRTMNEKNSEMSSSGTYWKKKSIFFELEYWKFLDVRHCLDVMHIEKNVCANLIGTLLDIPGKTKDGVKSRLDLVELNIRSELAPQVGEKKIFLPPACYTLSRAEKLSFCKTLSELKVPEGYSSNIQSLVSLTDLKLYGLKSHDHHVLMQQLLPVAIRGILPKHVRLAIIRLCFFFNAICKKTIDTSQLKGMQEDVVVTLCLLEKYFPPSFFTIMVHLVVHLVREIEFCGPVHLRWMYPFERYMKVLKTYVRNRNRPEGCMVENYIVEEAIEFCSEFIAGVSSIGLNSSVIKKNSNMDRALSASSFIRPSKEQLDQAHLYVIQNVNDVLPYVEQHMESLRKLNSGKARSKKWIQEEHNRSFSRWLSTRVALALEVPKNSITPSLRWIAHGPSPDVATYSGYIINGYYYHTKRRDDIRRVQNSGVSITATTMQVSSSKDKNPVMSDMTFYGVIREIWEIDYHQLSFILFKCDWVDNRSGVKVDELGFTIVDLKRIGHKSDSFILATQAKQVFYVQDSANPEWSVVLTSPQRTIEEDFFEDEIGDMLQECGYETIKRMPNVDTPNETDDTNSTYIRHDCEGRWVEKVRNITAIFMMEDSSEDEREMLPEVRKKSFVPRGPTTMSELALVRNSGQKLPIQFNEHGQPVGATSKKMQSYIGVCVRQQIPITYNSWKEVPNELKDKIYDCISMSFDLQPNAKHSILMSASRKFRTFKTTLTQKYILPSKDQPSLLQFPPKIYSHINQEDWESFVDARLSEEWEDYSRIQRERRSKCVYNHHMSRKGYANLADELKITHDVSYRSTLWKEARKGKNNDYFDDATRDFATNKNEDILTDALGSKEHGGRVRGVGAFVSQSQYFNTVKGKEKMCHKEEDDSRCKSDKKRSNHSRSSIGSINIDLDADEDTPTNKGVEEHSTRKDVVYPSNYTDVNGIIKLLNRHAMNNMEDVDMIRIPMNELIFGSDKFVYLAREDLLHYCGMVEIGYMCILAYITCLWDKCDCAKNFFVIDQSKISSHIKDRDLRSRNLANQLEAVNLEQKVLIPYNTGFHWMLHVIDLRENCVYVLDSLRSKVNEDIHGIINVGLKTWQAKHDLQRYRSTPKWRPVKCPRQLDSVGCGYYVQKYIHEIVHNSSTSITNLFNTKNAYRQEEIDEIRTEWAAFVSRFVCLLLVCHGW